MKEMITCNVEEVNDEVIVSEGESFTGYNCRTDKEARSGKYSIALSKERGMYGLAYMIEQPPIGQKYTASVWAKSGGKLVVQGGEMRIVEGANPANPDWQRIEIVFRAPPYNKSTIEVFCWNPKEEPAYFDDLAIRQLLNQKTTLDSINIEIPEKTLNSLRKSRARALEEDIISPQIKKYMKAKIQREDGEIPIKLRLKGDWIDHVESDKISLRVKSKEPLYGNISRFAIQSPSMRYFIHEWVYHQMLENEGLLTTKFDFVNVNFNSIDYGVYALEEHFTASLLSRYGKKEGVIMKYEEERFFEWAVKFKVDSSAVEPKISELPIKFYQPFGQLDINEKNKARQLVEAYVLATEDVAKIFHMDELARFFALVDLNHAYHSIRWHNMRWYYSPQGQKLEPVGYDGIGSDGLVSDKDLVLLINRRFGAKLDHLSSDNYIKKCFENDEFRALYLEYIRLFSSEKYVEGFQHKYAEAIKNYEREIQYDFPHYRYDYSYLPNRAKDMRVALDKFE